MRGFPLYSTPHLERTVPTSSTSGPTLKAQRSPEALSKSHYTTVRDAVISDAPAT